MSTFHEKGTPAGLSHANATVLDHAQRLGLRPEQLLEALLKHGALELAAWAEAQEADDPGCVWHTGDVPEWLEPHLPPPPEETSFCAADDTHDAAADAIRAINARLSRRGLQLEPASFDALREQLADDLQLAVVVEVAR